MVVGVDGQRYATPDHELYGVTGEGRGKKSRFWRYVVPGRSLLQAKAIVLSNLLRNM